MSLCNSIFHTAESLLRVVLACVKVSMFSFLGLVFVPKTECNVHCYRDTMTVMTFQCHTILFQASTSLG